MRGRREVRKDLGKAGTMAIRSGAIVIWVRSIPSFFSQH